MKPEDFHEKHVPVTCRPEKEADLARLDDIVQHINAHFENAASLVQCVHARYQGDAFVRTPLGLAITVPNGAKLNGFTLCPHCIREAADDLRQTAQCLEDFALEVEKHNATNVKLKI